MGQEEGRCVKGHARRVRSVGRSCVSPRAPRIDRCSVNITALLSTDICAGLSSRRVCAHDLGERRRVCRCKGVDPWSWGARRLPPDARTSPSVNIGAGEVVLANRQHKGPLCREEVKAINCFSLHAGMSMLKENLDSHRRRQCIGDRQSLPLDTQRVTPLDLCRLEVALQQDSPMASPRRPRSFCACLLPRILANDAHF